MSVSESTLYKEHYDLPLSFNENKDLAFYSFCFEEQTMHLDKNYQYQLYEETEIVWDKDHSRFTVLTPWISLSVDVEQGQRDELAEITKSLRLPFNSWHQNKVNEFIRFFHEYPIAYIQPRSLPIDLFKQSTRARKDILSISNPRSLITKLLPQGLEKKQIEKVPLNWVWDTDKVLRLSQIEVDTSELLYDPISAYRAIYRLRLIAEQSFNSMGTVVELLSDLRESDENAFFKAITQIISQTYYVTSNCIECLSPAVYAYPPAANEVREFIKKEEGHDLLILQSLKKLSVNISCFEILPETVLNMEILKLAAQDYFLAFCCIIGAFEGGAYRQEDPIATLLRRSSIPEAAFGLERHFLVNKEGNHAAIGESLIEKMGAVSRDEVIIATRLTELVTYAGHLMSFSLLSSIEKAIK